MSNNDKDTYLGVLIALLFFGGLLVVCLGLGWFFNFIDTL